MLQKEFEERIGRSVSQEEYVEANAMYELAGDSVDKDVFCREWKKIGDTALVKGLFETAYQRGRELAEHKLMLEECREMLSDAADAMLELEAGVLGGETVERAAQELEKKAFWLLGSRKQLVLRKLQRGIALSEEDVEYINNNLK